MARQKQEQQAPRKPFKVINVYYPLADFTWLNDMKAYAELYFDPYVEIKPADQVWVPPLSAEDRKNIPTFNLDGIKALKEALDDLRFDQSSGIELGVERLTSAIKNPNRIVATHAHAPDEGSEFLAAKADVRDMFAEVTGMTFNERYVKFIYDTRIGTVDTIDPDNVIPKLDARYRPDHLDLGPLQIFGNHTNFDTFPPEVTQFHL